MFQADFKRCFIFTMFILLLNATVLQVYSFPGFAKDKNGVENDEQEEKEFSLDDLDEESEKNTPTSVASSALKRMKINVMFDFSFDAIIGNHTEKKPSFGSNHQYIILGITPSDKIRFSAEITNLVYWECAVKMTPRTTLKLGKLPIPFSSQFFHQLYGGIIEKPMITGQNRPILVPRDWAEYGMELDWHLVDQMVYGLTAKFWLSNGLKADINDYNLGTQSIDLKLTGSSDNNYDKGFGLRLDNQLFRGKIKVGLSGYTSKWADDLDSDYNILDGDRVYLANIDLDIQKHLVDIPLLRNIRFKGALAVSKTNITRRLTDEISLPTQSIIRRSSFAEVMYYRLTKWMDIQFRFGTHDDNIDIINKYDLINYNVGIYLHPNPYLLLITRYYFNRERVNEVKDDYLLIKAVIQL